MQNQELVIHSDGGSRGNPGTAACAFVAEIGKDAIEKKSKYLGITTNNIAEYSGVLIATEWLLENERYRNYNSVIFYLDSELVVKQINGIYKIKNRELLELSIKIKNNLQKMGNEFLFRNIPREENKVADYLVNQELDSQ